MLFEALSHVECVLMDLAVQLGLFPGNGEDGILEFGQQLESITRL